MPLLFLHRSNNTSKKTFSADLSILLLILSIKKQFITFKIFILSLKWKQKLCLYSKMYLVICSIIILVFPGFLNFQKVISSEKKLPLLKTFIRDKPLFDPSFISIVRFSAWTEISTPYKPTPVFWCSWKINQSFNYFLIIIHLINIHMALKVNQLVVQNT